MEGSVEADTSSKFGVSVPLLEEEYLEGVTRNCCHYPGNLVLLETGEVVPAVSRCIVVQKLVLLDAGQIVEKETELSKGDKMRAVVKR